MDKGDWIEMEKTLEADPFYVELRKVEKDAINAPIKSDHLWKSLLPPNLTRGVHSLEVITRDTYGREFSATRVLRVE